MLAEYFGYLRRDPDHGGYDFWLNVLNNAKPANFRGLVCLFNSLVTHTKRESGQ
jgi:hypothetical protein